MQDVMSRCLTSDSKYTSLLIFEDMARSNGGNDPRGLSFASPQMWVIRRLDFMNKNQKNSGGSDALSQLLYQQLETECHRSIVHCSGPFLALRHVTYPNLVGSVRHTDSKNASCSSLQGLFNSLISVSPPDTHKNCADEEIHEGNDESRKFTGVLYR
jgi:hypothetical protein